MSHIHILLDGDFEVWLDTEIEKRDGLCIGVGNTEHDAITNALDDLEDAKKELQDRLRLVDAAKELKPAR